MIQKEAILKYMAKGNSLTALQALNMFGTFRLSARIHNLKQDGYHFTTQRIKVWTRTGSATVTKYRLIGRVKHGQDLN